MTATITPEQMLRFLGIGHRRLSNWNAVGLFGEAVRKVGRGRARAYSLQDAATARVAREILDLTKTRAIRIANDWVQLFQDAAAASGMIRSKDGTAVEWGTLFVMWMGTDFHSVLIPGRANDVFAEVREKARMRGFRKPMSTIVVDVEGIMAEARAFFASEGIPL